MTTPEQKFKIIDSTNSEAQRQLQSGDAPKEDFVIRAEFQTDGRGQRGHSWTSDHSENLTFSYVYIPEKLEVQNKFQVLQAAALSVARFVERFGIEDVSIKWPNDIYVGMKKICGMLIENTLSGHYIKSSVIGIGVNINQTRYPENLPNPVSMSLITGRQYDLDTMFYTIVDIIRDELGKLQKENFPELKRRYMEKLLGLGRPLIYSSNGRIFKGIIRDVDMHGYITIEDAESGTSQAYDFNEVNLVIPEQQKD